MLRHCLSPFKRNIHNFNRTNLIHSHFTRNGSTLIVGEHSNGSLTDSTKSCITAASEIPNNESINILISGSNCESIATEASKLCNINKVIYCDNSLYSSFGLSENHSNLICSVIEKYSFTHILAGISSYTKDVIPRCAGILDISQISDCMKIIDENTFQRGIYAGNAICNVQSNENIKLITIRPTSFDSDINTTNTQCEIEIYSPSDEFNGKQFITDEITKSSGPSLTSASAVISGGRGMKNSENFKMLRDMCELIPDCAMGASRAAVDAGYVGNDLQVGQTGKCVAPNVYIAVGISGAIQHIAGMKDSKLIIAINNDPEAPIFSIADYGYCADLFDAVPKLTDMLKGNAK
eukprot:197470_1